MKVIDNHLSESHFKHIQSVLMADDFPWFFQDGINYIPDLDRYQFTHLFYDYQNNSKSNRNSDWLEFVDSIVEFHFLKRIKANLNHRTLFHRKSGYHVDYVSNPSHKTSIFYINTNNGWTEFANGDRVKCVENRLVTFDSNLKHQGVTCTDKKRKIVINLNYEG